MSTSPLQLLIVEDEPIIALALHLMVTRLGYVVLATVASGEDAIHHVQALRPDLVLMDIGLQGAMGGIAVAEHIRMQWQIPSVFITAYTDARTLVKAERAQPLGYLWKPFEVCEVEATLKQACVYLQRRDPMNEPAVVADALRQLEDKARELAARRFPGGAEERQLAREALVVALEAIHLATKALHWATVALRQVREH
jgi:CheY-like chemotaxis protein